MVDNIDIRILDILETNSRLSYAAIGRMVNLSTSATRERIIRLEENKIIKSYSIKIDNALIGKDIETIILMTARPGKLKILTKKLFEAPEVKEVLSVKLRYNLHIKAIFNNTKHMQEFLESFILYGESTTLVTTEIPISRLD